MTKKTIEEKIASACLKVGITDKPAIDEVQDLYKAGVIAKPPGEEKLRKCDIRNFFGVEARGAARMVFR